MKKAGARAKTRLLQNFSENKTQKRHMKIGR